MNQLVIDPMGIIRFGPLTTERPKVVVAVPARNEEERLPACIRALNAQTGLKGCPASIVVMLNNCTDDSLATLSGIKDQMRLPTWAVSIELPGALANAGHARKAAMDYAASIMDRDGIILTTDADTIPDADWVQNNLAEFDTGADAVAGFVTADPEELSRLPAPILERGALEWEYQNIAAEIESWADPRPYDPWPRHNQNCGASAGITRRFYQRIGGLPPAPVGEDRALFEEVRKRDGHVRHSLAAHVVTSARTQGRAFGGMADALRLRDDPNYPCDDILETALQTLRRNKLRSKCRKLWLAGDFNRIAHLLGVYEHNARWNVEYFGEFWHDVEGLSLLLERKPLTAASLTCELGKLQRLINRLRRQRRTK